MNRKLIPPLIGTGLSTVLLCIVGVESTGRFRLDPRNVALANKLAVCPSREGVGGDIRVGYDIGGNIVFDVRSCRGDARLIDPLHLLLQFGHAIRGERFGYLSIASAGEEVYRLEKPDLDELAEQYELDARLWAFNHWPERLRKPDGEPAFGGWSGGALGVLMEQAEDLNEALKAWLNKAASTSAPPVPGG